MQSPDDRLRKAREHAEKIRNAIVKLLATDAAEAAQIRTASDRMLAVADQTHKHPLPTLSQVRNWQTSHIEETKRYMHDAMEAWRAAGVAHQHAVDMYDLAAETDGKGLKVNTADLRQVAENLRAHASKMKLIKRRYRSDVIQTSAYACDEAIGRINEKHTAIAARLRDTANKLVESAAEYDMAPADRPRHARQRPM
jgi:light-regulated signal transduction histidine kinase (bacteriophytochrome)